MSKRAHLSFGLIGPVGALLLLAVSGCGDDDSPNDAGPAGKGGGGGSGGQTAGSSSAGRSGSSAGAGGAQGMGILPEGEQCVNTAECAPGMVCVTAAVGQQAVRVCARPCTAATEAMDCGKSDAGGKGVEICDSPYTNLAKDAHCINFEPDAYAFCGVGETAACDGELACLYFPNSTVGVCVNLCATDPTQDAGVEGLAASCSTSQICVEGVVENEAVGVCGTQVARDAECGIEKGIFCSGTDICVPDDLNADMGPEHCREDCTDTNACASGGVCTAVRNLFKYCKK